MPIKKSVNANFDYRKALEKLYQTLAETFDDDFTYRSGDPKDKPMNEVKDGKELWKFIPCTYDSEFLAKIEKVNKIKLPPPYKQYLLSCHHSMGHFLGFNSISDPANLRNCSRYRLLVQLGYIPLGTDPYERDIFCLKRRKTSATGEYSVYVIESKYYYMALEMGDAMEYGKDAFPYERDIFCLKRRKTSATGEYSVYVIESKYYYMALEMGDAMEYGKDAFYEYNYGDWEESPEDILRSGLMKIASSLSEFITYLSDKENLEDYII